MAGLMAFFMGKPSESLLPLNSLTDIPVVLFDGHQGGMSTTQKAGAFRGRRDGAGCGLFKLHITLCHLLHTFQEQQGHGCTCPEGLRAQLEIFRRSCGPTN